MTFEEWYEQNKREIEKPNHTRELSEFGWLRRAFEAGAEHGIHTERKKQIEDTPQYYYYYKEGDKVQVFVRTKEKPDGTWIDGVVVVRNFSSLGGDKEVLVEFKRLDGGTDDQGFDVERRNFLFTQIRKIW